jgi:hypothetical protein
MPIIKDNNNVVLFTEPLKIYLFKDKQRVKVSFKITDYVVINREFKQDNFEYILENYNIRDGIQGNIKDIDDNKVWWFHSKFGPRPESKPANFVGINFNRYSFRIAVQEMERIKENYYHQKSNKMHWD